MGSSGDAVDAAGDRMFPGGGVVDVADDTRRQKLPFWWLKNILWYPEAKDRSKRFLLFFGGAP